jgi:DNA-binding transcriptional MocR family regulator
LAEWETDWSLHRLESLLVTHKPKLIFTTPTFHNPTGRVMPLATRQGLLNLAGRFHVPIVEDDVYSRAPLGGAVSPPSLLSLDRQNIVAYLSTFSKILAPGLRVGWVVAPTYLIKQLSLMKMRANLFTEGVHQMVIAELIESGKLQEHLEKMNRYHTELRDVLVQSFSEACKSSILSFEVPEGGLYLWCKVRDDIELDMALDWAEREGVFVAPGQAFFSKGEGQRQFRLCFTAASKDQLERGAALLTDALRKVA